MASKKQGEPKLRKIYKHDREALLAAMEDRLRVSGSDSDKEAAKKAKMAETWKSYTVRYRSAAKDGGPNIFYEQIGEFLSAAQMSYLEMLEICCGRDGEKADIGWPKRIEKNMASLLDTLPEDAVDILEREIIGILPSNISAELYADDLNIRHFFAVADYLASDISFVWGRLGEGGEYLKVSYSQKDDEKKPFLEVLPYQMVKALSEAFDLSPHFLLGLHQEVCLAKKARTEKIMDAFCVLPDDWKNRIYLGAKNLKSMLGKKDTGVQK